MTTINLKDKIERYPVLVTKERWPHSYEGQWENANWGNLFGRFPTLKDDPRYVEYGECPDQPENPLPGSLGGGLFPVLVKTPEGKLVCALRTGAAHKNTPGAQISITVSSDKGKTWSPYKVAVQGCKGQDARNHSIGIIDNLTYVLSYGVVDLRENKKWMEVVRSVDAGESWSDPQLIEHSTNLDFIAPHGQMKKVDDKILAFNARGAYSSDKRKQNPELPERESYLFFSYDKGLTFSETVHLGPRTETSFCLLDKTNWICYSRLPYANPQVGHSQDSGKNWGEWQDAFPDIEFRQDFSSYAAPGVILKLASGRTAIIHSWRDYPFGIRAVISNDNGQNFDWDRQFILTDSFWTYDSGYPSTVCYDDGTIVTVAYAIKDVANPEWGTCSVAYVYNENIFQ